MCHNSGLIWRFLGLRPGKDLLALILWQRLSILFPVWPISPFIVKE